jgi:hypothetical protein
MMRSKSTQNDLNEAQTAVKQAVLSSNRLDEIVNEDTGKASDSRLFVGVSNARQQKANPLPS